MLAVKGDALEIGSSKELPIPLTEQINPNKSAAYLILHVHKLFFLFFLIGCAQAVG